MIEAQLPVTIEPAGGITTIIDPVSGLHVPRKRAVPAGVSSAAREQLVEERAIAAEKREVPKRLRCHCAGDRGDHSLGREVGGDRQPDVC
jgi:hypothetical protein